jgi:prepilin peptidase CpaA
LALIVLLLAGFCLVLAAASDVRAFRIPNIYPALLILLFLATRGITGFVPADWGHLIHFGIALVVGMALFKMGWVGGGDAKLYAAAAIWFTGINAAFLIFATGLAGLILAIFYLLMRKLGSKADPSKRADRRIPYGVAIAGGAICMGVMEGIHGLVPLAPATF